MEAASRTLRRLRTRPGWVAGVVPLAVLGAAIAAFVALGAPGLDRVGVPQEELSVERTVLRPGQIELHVVNDGPDPVRVRQVIVNDGFASFTQSDGRIGRLGSAEIDVAYPWIEAETYEVSLLTSTGATIEHTIDSIRPRRRPTLWFHHALLPHAPWVYLPDGRRHAETVGDAYGGFQANPAFHDSALTRHNHLRHLLQVGYVDSLVKRLLDRLAVTGMEGNTVVVVVADHGYSWEVGVPDRRSLTASNIDEVAPVPIFIAAPGQRRGLASRALVRTTDVLPTVARLLGIRIPWRIHGRPAGSPAVRARRAISMPDRHFRRTFRISQSELERRRRANVGLWLPAFGHGTWDSLFSAGSSHPELLGRDPAGIATADPNGLSASFHPEADRLRSYDPAQPVVPIWIAGEVSGGSPRATRDVAAAVNGHIVAVDRSFHLRGDPAERFSLLYPTRHVRPGANTLELYEVLPGPELRPLGGVR